MRILIFFTLSIASSFLMSDPTSEKNSSKYENFSQCDSTKHLEKSIELLTQELQKFVTEVQSERLKQRKIQEQKREEYLRQKEEREQFIEWLESLPWYQRYSLHIIANTKPWIEEQLWPIIKSILTQMIARKIVEKGLSGTDYILGDIPQAILPNRIGATLACRPGAFLNLSDEQRKQKNAEHKLYYSDSDYRKMKKEIQSLETELNPILRKSQQFEKLQNLKIKEALIALQKNEKYKKISEEFAQLNLEVAAFRHLHNLYAEKEKLERLKKDMLNYTTPSTSFVEEVLNAEEEQ